ncbi:hypothetical protein CHS0354_034259 [Potamilus streckersoni]|uniref:Uncharacterized protein n=1 Tax=Potamilus streckersoni TaxID=2493646 RepID=A0AAE0S4X2_9BIVA|nr:hypothetical protein CHS0354_034259 [Potamilus streckersoni]
MPMNSTQYSFVLMMFVDLTTVSIKDRRTALTSVMDIIGNNSIMIIGNYFKSIAILANVAFTLAASLFHSKTHTSSADISKLRMKDLNIVYKRDNENYQWIDQYICQQLKEHLVLKLELCTKISAFLEFDFSNNVLRRGKTQTVGKFGKEMFTDGFLDRLTFTGSDVWKQGGSISDANGSHTLPIFFEKRSDEENGVTIQTYIVCSKDSNYERPVTPNYNHISHDGKNQIRDMPKKRTIYSQFTQYFTRLATFVHCNFFTDHQPFAQLGFFYKGQGDKVCCYECGVTLSDWRKDDDPLLEHIRYSPECQHLATIIDPTFLASCKVELQQRLGKDSSVEASGVKQENHISNWDNKKIRSPEYSSYSVRLSTFSRFPVIHGVNVNILAAAGFYYTGYEDAVRCYTCDGGLKKWVPGDDPWEEHCKWFPDCPHLEQSNYKPSLREANPDLSETRSTSSEKTSPSKGLVGRLDNMTTREEKKIQDDPNLDMNTPAVLAVLEYGYSKEAVTKAISELRKKGTEKLTAHGILDILLSNQGTDFTQSATEIGEPDPRDVNLKMKETSFKKELSKERSPSKISNKNMIAETKGKATELGLLLKENEMLTSKMMCKRCRKKQRNILVLPCTHFSLCDQCSKEISLCAECWKPIKERIRTYVS